jgi:ketol-acid reductoisomerase
VELAFEQMVAYGLQPESAYYESLHETPLIANTIARKKLFEMNRVISDTAEYGCYLYSQACEPLLKDFMAKQDIDVIGTKYNKSGSNQVIDSIAQSTSHVPPFSFSCTQTHMMTTPC